MTAGKETITFPTRRPHKDASPEAQRVHNTRDEKQRRDPNRRPIEKAPVKREGGHHA